jgi:hypothetical protein
MFDFGEEIRRARAQADRDAMAAAAADAAVAVPSVGSLSGIFKEEPVPLTVFVQDKGYLGNPPLSAVQYDAVRHIERIYYPDMYKRLADEFETGKKADRLYVGSVSAWREEPYWSEKLRMVNFITLQWGKGSGKDHICRVASMRVAYLLMCLQSPQQYYELPQQDTIHLLNVASSSGQAQQAFFMPVVRAVKSGWFKDKCTPRQNSISFAGNIESVSGHSDAESQEGLNLLLAIADEIDAFRSKTEMITRKAASSREPTKSAEGILNMIKSSSSTRFPECFKNVRISYPRYLGSTIQRLTDDAKKDIAENGRKSRHYVSGPLPTWVVNPRVKGKEAFKDDYREDPVTAKAKYECKPSRAVNPYFRNVKALDACFTPYNRLPVTVDYVVETSNNRRVWVPRYEFADWFKPVRGARYVMHADLAIKGDAAGIALAHVADYSEHSAFSLDQDGADHHMREVRPHVKVDFVITYKADISQDPPREIQIRWARQLCFELIRRGFNIQLYTFDTFQSADSMQILEEKGIKTAKVSTDLTGDPWRNLLDLVSDGRISIPRLRYKDENDPLHESFLLRDELLSLTRMPNGRLDHPADGSKDAADALACAVLGAIQLGGREEKGAPRSYYGEAKIVTGGRADLPFGVRSLSTVWANELPSPF